MRTVKKPETRKQEILEGALSVFLKNGYEKTTIADISRELGISQGLCYRYFASKEEIYSEVIRVYAVKIAEANMSFRSQDQSIGQWIDTIPQLLKTMEAEEQKHPQLYELLHHPLNHKMHCELCLKVAEYMAPSVTAVLEQAKERGEIQISDCQRTAIFGLYGEIGLLLTAGPKPYSAVQENWRRLLGIL